MSRLMLLSVLAVSLPAGGYAWAQAVSDQSIMLPEIEITAQKRSENPREVPISVTIYDGQSLKDAQSTDLTDVIQRTPNVFQFKTGGRGDATTLSMRGITSSNADFANPTVGLVVDGVNHGGGYDLDFFDVERIEVLRGPQSTLYGGNTPGGLINVISKRPGFAWENEADFTIGNHGTFQERLAVGGPISDNLAFRVTGVKLNSDGYIQNGTLGGPGESRDDFNLRGQLRFKPNEAWDVLLNLNGFSYNGSFASYAPLAQLDRAHRRVYSGETGDQDQTAFGQILEANYRGETFNFTSITGHRYWKSVEYIDADYTADRLAVDRSNKSNDQYSQEFRFSSPDGDRRLKWLGGAFVAHERQTIGDQFTYWPPLYGAGSRSTDAGEMVTDQRNLAVFGQGTYGLTDKFFVTAGLRYDTVRKDVEANAVFSDGSGSYPNPTLTGTKNFDAVLPKVALEYRWTPDVNTYATVARGYKPGGFPAYSWRNGNEPYKSEYTWNYEVGVKTSLFNDRLKLNAAAFHIDFQDQQFATLVRPNVTIISNIGKSHSTGLELDATALVAPGWEVFGSLGVVDAKVDELDSSTSGAIEGGRPANVPRYQATFGTQYRSAAGFFARLENVAVGSYYLNGTNTVEQDRFMLVNASLGWEFDRVQVYGFVKNLFDETYLTRSFGGTLAGQGFVGREGAPRTIGLVTRVQF